MPEATIRTLGVEPDEGKVPQHMYDHRQATVYPKLKPFGVETIVGPDAHFTAVRDRLIDLGGQVTFVTASGHGTKNEFIGHQSGAVFATFNTHSELRGKIVHLLACDAAKNLGVHLIESAQCAAFFGYKEDFSFYEGKPGLTDEILLRDSEIDIAFSEGLTAGEVSARVKKIWQKAIDESCTKRPNLAAILRKNLESLEILMNDPSAKL